MLNYFPHNPHYKIAVTTIALTGAIIFIGYGIRYILKRRRTFHAVGVIAQLNIYPIKGCKAISVQSAKCTDVGLHYDDINDRWFLITDENYKLINQKTVNHLALVQPSIHGNWLHIDAPEMDTFKLLLSSIVDSDKIKKCSVLDFEMSGLDRGDEVAAWLSSYLKIQARLIQHIPGMGRKPVRFKKALRIFGKKTDETVFNSVAPYLVTNEASLADMNRHIENKVSMQNFRPNIVLACSEPWTEDKWKYLRIGTSEFRTILPCLRCSVTSVDQNTAEVDKYEPLRTLRSFRLPEDERIKSVSPGAPAFGLYMAADSFGPIKLGDIAYVNYK